MTNRTIYLRPSAGMRPGLFRCITFAKSVRWKAPRTERMLVGSCVYNRASILPAGLIRFAALWKPKDLLGSMRIRRTLRRDAAGWFAEEQTAELLGRFDQELTKQSLSWRIRSASLSGDGIVRPGRQPRRPGPKFSQG